MLRVKHDLNGKKVKRIESNEVCLNNCDGESMAQLGEGLGDRMERHK